eukprot:TRINITY_DN10164_c0_g1_i1.p1 TRINITY_DN10164_c0_g1~~TRINITY_DN10164_c0_g1_i1.p1  ORF type:complete len:1008 (+),score=445.53 TRINITY_DN10164_c0_g1_i1:63-3086(+)
MAMVKSPGAAAGSGCHAASEIRSACGGDADGIEQILRKCRLQGPDGRERRGFGWFLVPFFMDNDALRRYTVGWERFGAVLRKANITLAPEEVEQLCRYYAKNGKEDLVNYKAFCNDLDRDELFEGVPAEAKAGPLQSVGGDDAAMLSRLLSRFAALSTSLSLKACFQDFDKLRSGQVSSTQFERALPFEVNREELRVLLYSYHCQNSLRGAAKDRVNYARFCTDVDALGDVAEGAAAQSPTRARAAASPPSAPKSRNVDELLALIRQKVKVYRIRILETMQDYDKLRCGSITQAQFKSCFSRLRLHRFNLDKDELQALCDRYMITDAQGVAKVQYTKFHDAIEEVFTVKGLEKQPGATQHFDDGDFRNDPKTASLTADEEARVECIMTKIKTTVQCRRVLLKPMFHDYDRASKGIYQTWHTSKSQFERVLAMHVPALSPAEYELLERKYATPGDANNVNYVLFCNHLDDQETKAAIIPPSFQASDTEYVRIGRKEPDTHLQDLVDDIRAQILTQRVRIYDFFRDYDKLRSGLISVAQFGRGLSMARVELSAEELQKLAEHYRQPGDGDRVRWMAFADSVDEVFTTKNLEAQPEKSTQKQLEITQRMAMEREALVEGQMQQILEKLKSAVRARGILLPPFFRDFDTHNCGQIAPNRLQQAMSRHSFNLSSREIATIVRCYQDPRTRDVCYRKLIQDIDDFEDGIGGGYGGISPRRGGHHYSPSRARGGGSPGSPMNSTGGFRRTRQSEKKITLEDTLDSIKGKVHRNRIRLNEFFTDPDPLRKGVVPLPKFRTGLDMARLDLTESQFELLEAKYSIAGWQGCIDYKTFIADVTVETHAQNLEKNPTKEIATYTPMPRIPRQQNGDSLKARMQDRTQDVADAFARVAEEAKYTPDFVGTFRRLDRSNERFKIQYGGALPSGDFDTAMESLGVLKRTSPRDATLLGSIKKAYTVMVDPQMMTGSVRDYVDFLALVSDVEAHLRTHGGFGEDPWQGLRAAQKMKACGTVRE